jgi:hypothetical protein
MKNIIDFLNEQFEEKIEVELNESKIESEEDFRKAAKEKFEEVFGDELDEKKMNKTIDGLLKNNKDLVEDGKWGQLIGMLNKSFNESEENEESIEENIEESCKNCSELDKMLDKMPEDKLWDELGFLHKVKDEKERNEMFNKIKSQIQKLQHEKK